MRIYLEEKKARILTFTVVLLAASALAGEPSKEEVSEPGLFTGPPGLTYDLADSSSGPGWATSTTRFVCEGLLPTLFHPRNRWRSWTLLEPMRGESERVFFPADTSHTWSRGLKLLSIGF